MLLQTICIDFAYYNFPKLAAGPLIIIGSLHQFPAHIISLWTPLIFTTQKCIMCCCSTILQTRHPYLLFFCGLQMCFWSAEPFAYCPHWLCKSSEMKHGNVCTALCKLHWSLAPSVVYPWGDEWCSSRKIEYPVSGRWEKGTTGDGWLKNTHSWCVVRY